MVHNCTTIHTLQPLKQESTTVGLALIDTGKFVLSMQTFGHEHYALHYAREITQLLIFAELQCVLFYAIKTRLQ